MKELLLLVCLFAAITISGQQSSVPIKDKQAHEITLDKHGNDVCVKHGNILKPYQSARTTPRLKVKRRRLKKRHHYLVPVYL